MYHQTARRLVLILVAAAATTACAPTEVSPLTGYTTTDTSATPSPASSTAPDSTPTISSPARSTAPDSTPAATSATPSQSNTCVGSTFSIDGADSADSPKSLCFTAGGVLRIENVHPGDVSADPSDRVTCQWEAGIATCRFLRAGNVTVRIAGQSPARSIEVVIV
jgi:hypothetical protein